MADTTMTMRTPRTSPADRVLRGAAVVWFVVAAAGHWIFASYVLGFYGVTAVRGDFEAWNDRLFRGIVAGDPVGNAAVAIHLLLAFIVAFCGPLQLIPHIRRRFPGMHRLNGRVYGASAFAISAVGLYLIVARGGVSLTGDVSLGLNGILVMSFAAAALRHAIARNIETHRRWALRLFLAAGGFLFARIGFQAWIFLTRGAGHTNGFDGPFDVFWGFGSYLVPLALLEVYRYARHRAGAPGKWATAGMLVVVTAIMVQGTFLVAAGMSLPGAAVREDADPASTGEDAPFQSEIYAFVIEDQVIAPEPCGTLFLGSSSIRFWFTLEQDFPERRVINRGFGGAAFEDVIAYFDRVVVPHAPREIVLYAGENDIHAGASPEHVLSELEDFMDLKTGRLGETPVYFISIKPSKARVDEGILQAKANALVRRLAAKRADLVFVDVVPAMLDGGKPGDFFIGDDLHMTIEGYRLWKEAVSHALRDSVASTSQACLGSSG